MKPSSTGVWRGGWGAGERGRPKCCTRARPANPAGVRATECVSGTRHVGRANGIGTCSRPPARQQRPHHRAHVKQSAPPLWPTARARTRTTGAKLTRHLCDARGGAPRPRLISARRNILARVSLPPPLFHFYSPVHPIPFFPSALAHHQQCRVGEDTQELQDGEGAEVDEEEGGGRRSRVHGRTCSPLELAVGLTAAISSRPRAPVNRATELDGRVSERKTPAEAGALTRAAVSGRRRDYPN